VPRTVNPLAHRDRIPVVVEWALCISLELAWACAGMNYALMVAYLVLSLLWLSSNFVLLPVSANLLATTVSCAG
jgi:hypothetical protein